MFQTQLLALLCGVGFAAACADQSALTSPSQATSTDALAADSRATVNRFAAWYAAVLVDENRHLTVVAGVPFEQLADVCEEGTGLFTLDSATIHTVQRPDESFAVRWQGKDVNVVIFEGEFPGDFCTGFYTTLPLAIGTTHATFHDNDFFVSGNRTDSYHFDLTGKGVYTATGQPARITVKSQGLVAKDGSILKLTTDIRLRS